MIIRFTYPRLAAGLAAGAILGLFLSGVAYAITGNVFRYSTPKTGYYSINASDLRPSTDNVDYGDFGDRILLESGNGCFSTTLHLPHRAKLTKLIVWHSSTGPDLNITLFRLQHSTGTPQLLVGNVPVTDTSGNHVGKAFSLSGPLATANNAAFSYGLAICFTGTTSAFYSARLTYTYKDAGD